jgi:hypothetical protein
MAKSSLSTIGAKGFQVEFLSHAKAILEIDFPEALRELDEILGSRVIPVTHLVRGGGGETEITQDLRHGLDALGWSKHEFEIQKLVDGVKRESISHQVDHVRSLKNGKVALEIEWNNKDPFFDRDLENFKRLHTEGAISVGIIITRGQTLHDNVRTLISRFAREQKIASYRDLESFDLEPTSRQRKAVERRMHSAKISFGDAWVEVFCSDKYGQATTHWRKLEDRVRRGVGNPCPLLLIGIPDSIVSFET